MSATDAHSVPLSRVLATLRALGVDPVETDDLASVHFDPGVITVTRFRRNASGQFYNVGAGDLKLATEATDIAIDLDS